MARNNKTEVLDGSYKISTALNSSMYLDVCGISTDNCANIHLWSNNNENNQKFYIVNEENEYYKIIAAHSGKAVDVEGGGSTPQTNVWQYEWNGTNAQLWKFISAGNGYYYIQNKNGLYLDAACGKSQNGTNVWGYTLNKSSAQKWKLTATKVEEETKKISGIPEVNEYSSGVKIGNIRRVSQKSNLYNNGWTYSGCDFTSVAGVECGAACSSMAVSFLGVNISPGEICYRSGGGSLNFNTLWINWNNIKSSIASGNNFESYFNRYYDDKSYKYSPVIVHLTRYPGSNTHYVVVVGRNNNGTYKIVDPIDCYSTWDATITGGYITGLNGGVSCGIDQIIQYIK